MAKDDRDKIVEMTNNPCKYSLDELRRMPLMESTEKFESLCYDGDETEFLKSLGAISYEDFITKHKNW